MNLQDFNIIVGADNGLDGGLVAISAHRGDILEKIPMPTRLLRGKREIDPRSVRGWLLSLGEDPPNILVAIEEPLKHAKSSQAIRSMGISFGILCAASELAGCETQRVQVGDWQPAILGRTPKGQTKARALKVSGTLWPEEECWLAGPRCRVPHDGMIDAALIAHFARTKILS